jgi:hypothetical protein
MFFEEQYNELRSDHGLKEKDFFECNQQAQAQRPSSTGWGCWRAAVGDDIAYTKTVAPRVMALPE